MNYWQLVRVVNTSDLGYYDKFKLRYTVWRMTGGTT